MKSQVLHTVWRNISCEAAGEIWQLSLSGVKGLIGKFLLYILKNYEEQLQNAHFRNCDIFRCYI